MYIIYMRNYPQCDINMTEELDWPQFRTLKEANQFIADAEKEYTDVGWAYHRMYNAKFYAEKV